MNLAPITIFCYKRADTLKQTIDKLRLSTYAEHSDLIIYSDGPKNKKDIEGVNLVRDVIKNVEGFKSVSSILHSKNNGLAKSIITGVTQVLNDYGKIIVVEDDLLTSSNFLKFMNDGLATYRTDSKIFSISGYKPNIQIPSNYSYDSFFTLRSTSWGWATWQDRWSDINWTLDDFEEFAVNRVKVREFNAMGSNMFRLLKKQHEGKIDSWAIRWCYHQFKSQKYSVFPTISKVQNIGFGEEATHTTKGHAYFSTELDMSDNMNFRFPVSSTGLDQDIIRNFRNHYSFFNRFLSRLKGLFER